MDLYQCGSDTGHVLTLQSAVINAVRYHIYWRISPNFSANFDTESVGAGL